MIHVKFRFNKEKGNICMRVRGHAEDAPKGESLVCAGVSALALTAAECAEKMWNMGFLTRPPMISLKSGDSLIIVTPKEECILEALMCFWALEVGIHKLQTHFPSYVRIQEVLKV